MVDKRVLLKSAMPIRDPSAFARRLYNEKPRRQKELRCLGEAFPRVLF
jgi:hypothetical protein